MTFYTLKEKVEFIKEHSEPFIKDVHDYMVQTNWTWYDSELPPSEEKIKKTFFALLDELGTKTNAVTTGGFHVCINYDLNRIECYFGGDSTKKMGIKLVSDEKGNTIYDFINTLCADFPMLNRDYLLQKYNHLI